MLDRRQQGVERRKQKILSVTRDALRAGDGATGMRELASRAGLTVATLYNLFGSKQTILLSLLEQELDAIDAALSGGSVRDPVDRCRQLVDLSLSRFVRHANVFRPLLGAIEQHGSTPQRSAVMQRCASLLVVAIDDGIRDGVFRDDVGADLIARHVTWGYVHAIRYWASGDLTHEAFRTQVHSVLELALLGIATPRARARFTTRIAELAPRIRRITSPNARR